MPSFFGHNSASAKTPPPYWEDYLAALRQKKDPNSRLLDHPIVVFDTETTSLDIQKAEMIALGALKIVAGNIHIKDSFEYSVLSQAGEWDIDTIPIHGIIPSKQQNAQAAKEVIDQFIPYIADAILVGHHVKYDIAILNKVLDQHYGVKLENYCLDTRQLAMRVNQVRPNAPIDSQKYTLDHLCRQYNISLHDRHNAAGDALLTTRLFFKLLSELEDRDINQLRQFF